MRPAVRLRDVLRVLDRDEEACSRVLATFRARGGVQDRWERRDLEAMASAITAEEDRLEPVGDRVGARRLELADIRRALEDAWNDSDSRWVARRKARGLPLVDRPPPGSWNGGELERLRARVG